MWLKITANLETIFKFMFLKCLFLYSLLTNFPFYPINTVSVLILFLDNNIFRIEYILLALCYLRLVIPMCEAREGAVTCTSLQDGENYFPELFVLSNVAEDTEHT